MKSKLKEWLKRYLPANLISLILTVVSFKLTFIFTNNLILASFVGAIIGDNIGYYGTIVVRDLIADHKLHKDLNLKYTYKSFLKIVRNLILEFGFSEILDSYLIRPVILYFCSILINNQTFGLIIGKYLADFIFYIPTIFAYELRKKHLS